MVSNVADDQINTWNLEFVVYNFARTVGTIATQGHAVCVHMLSSIAMMSLPESLLNLDFVQFCILLLYSEFGILLADSHRL